MLRKKLMSFVLASTIFLSLSTTATAATYTYSHGNEPSTYRAFGGITSSEPSLVGMGYVLDVDGYNAVTYSPTYEPNSLYYRRYTQNLRGKAGYTYFRYYVNGVNTHNSTKPYRFDFR